VTSRPNFVLFSPAHFAILAATPLLGAVLAAIQRRLTPGAKWLRLGVAWLLLADTVLWYAELAARGQLTFPERVPLELCDASLFMMIVALFVMRASVFDLAYYTAIAGGSMALLTPNLWEPFPSLGTIQFFIAHGLTLAAALYLVWSGQARPRPGSVRRALLAVNLYAGLVIAFDFIFRTNFMYLLHKPENPSLLDFLGPWPWYILAAEGVALVLFSLLYLPFRERRAPWGDPGRSQEI